MKRGDFGGLAPPPWGFASDGPGKGPCIWVSHSWATGLYLGFARLPFIFARRLRQCLRPIKFASVSLSICCLSDVHSEKLHPRITQNPVRSAKLSSVGTG